MKSIKQLFGGDLRQLGMIFALAAIVAFFQFKTGGLTLDSGNMIGLISQYSYILILAIGMVMVIIAGHIDLSVGSVAAFVGIIVAKFMDNGMSWPLALLAGLVIGALVGAWQGYWVAYWGVPAFIVTLAGMMFFRGANQFVGNSTSLPVPEGFWVIGDGNLPEVGPATPYNNLTLLLGFIAAAFVLWQEFRNRRIRTAMHAENVPMWVSVGRSVFLAAIVLWAAFIFAGGRAGTSFPVPGLILVGLVVVYSFLMGRTVFGRHVYAVGGNLRAAALSGVNAKRTNFLVMLNMSVLAALAGMIFVARSRASGPADGNGWELDAIASVFIGGAAVTGGVGTVIGSMVGGLVMAFLNNGLLLLGVPQDRVLMIKGLVLLIAVAIDVYNKTQGRRSIIGYLTRKNHKDDDAPAESPPAAEMSPAPATKLP